MSDFRQEFQPRRPAGDLAASLRQDFDHEPTDDELVAFVHSEGLAAWLRVAETPREIRVEPGAIPLWFVAICLVPALAAWGWICQRAFAPGLNGPGELTAFVMSGLAFPATFSVVAILNRISWPPERSASRISSTRSSTCRVSANR